jgi:4'-phosphopantetheinyl transferase EntD
MDTDAVLKAWREMVPASVCVTAGPLLDDPRPLTARERASAGVVDAERMREFKSGREYAKRALEMLGVHCVELTVAPDRAPLWPSGVIGSLTHVRGPTGGHFAAAVARRHAVCNVGIDVEYATGLHPQIWNHILTPRELERILALPPQPRPIEVQLIWCAKEAIAKAARRPIEPTKIEIERDSTGDGYAATWHASRRADVASPTEIWRGRTARVQGFILAAVVLPRSS